MALERDEGLNAVRIARRLGVGEDKVRRWLREIRGPKKPVRDSVFQMLDDGCRRDEIASELGISEGYVERLERDRRGHARKWRRAADRLPGFLADPKSCRKRSWARSATFGHELVQECVRAVNRDPVKAEKVIELAIDHFATLRELRRKHETRRVTTCHLVQALAAQAARERVLQEPAKALETLRLAREESKDPDACAFCEAELSRREAIVLRDLDRYDEALALVDRARAIYLERGGEGHDPNRNGPANCAFAEASLLICKGRFERAMRVVEKVIPSVSPSDDEDLHVLLWHTLAYALLQRGKKDDLRRAAVLCDEQLARCGESPSLIRAKLSWFRAKIFEAEDDNDAARNKLEDALVDVREMKLPSGVAAITADLARLRPTRNALQRRLLDLMEWDDDLERKVLPNWLAPLRAVIEDVYRTARTDVRAAIEALRRDGRGDEFLPQLA